MNRKQWPVTLEEFPTKTQQLLAAPSWIIQCLVPSDEMQNMGQVAHGKVAVRLSATDIFPRGPPCPCHKLLRLATGSRRFYAWLSKYCDRFDCHRPGKTSNAVSKIQQ